MADITAVPEWSAEELNGLKAHYDLGSAVGDAATKYNPTPGAQRAGSWAEGRGTPWVTAAAAPVAQAPCATFIRRGSCLLQAAGARATSLCRPTITHFTTTMRSMCPSCKQTAASFQVRGETCSWVARPAFLAVLPWQKKERATGN